MLGCTAPILLAGGRELIRDVVSGRWYERYWWEWGVASWLLDGNDHGNGSAAGRADVG
jgi:hypothetical protein